MDDRGIPNEPLGRFLDVLGQLGHLLRQLLRTPGSPAGLALQTLFLSRYPRQPPLDIRDTLESPAWRKQAVRILLLRVIFISPVVVMYLACEVAVWGLTIALSHLHVDYLASIFGMLAVLCLMATLRKVWPPIDGIYHKNIKSRVSQPISPYCCGATNYQPIIMLRE